MFHQGWPLSSDDGYAQLVYFLDKGYRVIASDRRGHGRSSQLGTGHDMDHYAGDASAVVDRLDLHGAIHVGHSTGGGCTRDGVETQERVVDNWWRPGMTGAPRPTTSASRRSPRPTRPRT